MTEKEFDEMIDELIELCFEVESGEYISELDVEIERCHKLAEQNMDDEATTVAEMMVVRVQVLTEVKNDLENRLEELV